MKYQEVHYKKEVIFLSNKIVPLLHPVPVVLLGTTVNNQVNYTTIGDVAVAGLNPPLITVSLHEKHFSTIGLTTHGLFSINTPSEDMLAQVDYCGLVSGREEDKSTHIETKKGLLDIPYASQACFSLFCQVIEKVQVEQRIIFVAKVLETLIREDLILEEKIQWEQVKTISYGLNNCYYSSGIPIGIGYQEGKKKL